MEPVIGMCSEACLAHMFSMQPPLPRCAQFEASQRMLREQSDTLEAVLAEQKGMQLTCSKGHAQASGLASSAEALKKGAAARECFLTACTHLSRVCIPSTRLVTPGRALSHART